MTQHLLKVPHLSVTLHWQLYFNMNLVGQAICAPYQGVRTLNKIMVGLVEKEVRCSGADRSK
jgi:hypothetical protein